MHDIWWPSSLMLIDLHSSLRTHLQVVQLFESWAHHLSPHQFAEFGKPYAQHVLKGVKALHPETPVIYHANGGELLTISQSAPSHNHTSHYYFKETSPKSCRKIRDTEILCNQQFSHLHVDVCSEFLQGLYSSQGLLEAQSLEQSCMWCLPCCMP